MAPPKNTNSTKSAAAAAVAAPPVVVASTEEVAASTTPDVVVATATATVPATANAVADRVASATERTLAAIASLKDVSTVLKDVLSVLKTLQRDVAALQKETGKRGRRGAAAAAAAAAAAEGGAPVVARKPSGFAKPAPLTAELCAFLGVPDNTLMARTDVTRLITKYVKDNKLHNEADKRKIQPDGKLLKLLALKEEDKLTYFNLQSHLKPHFVKIVVVPAAAVAV